MNKIYKDVLGIQPCCIFFVWGAHLPRREGLFQPWPQTDTNRYPKHPKTTVSDSWLASCKQNSGTHPAETSQLQDSANTGLNNVQSGLTRRHTFNQNVRSIRVWDCTKIRRLACLLVLVADPFLEHKICNVQQLQPKSIPPLILKCNF